MYVVVPEKQEAMPVVVLLHGSGRSGEIMAQSWKHLAVREGFIVAAPDAVRPCHLAVAHGPAGVFPGRD